MRFLGAGAGRAVWPLLLAVMTAASGCRERAATHPPASAAGEAEPLPVVPAEGFVVLPWGTRTYLEPRFGGASARLGWPSTALPPWPTAGYVARVVGQRDGFVEIAPVMPPTTELHCGPLLDGEAFDVRLYVSPWALAPVLVRELEVSLDDGGTLSLRPGAVAQPIPDDPHGRWAISAGGLRVRAVLPDDAMGLAYAAAKPMTMPAQRSWQLPEGRPFSFDGWPIEVEQGFGQDVAITSVTPQDDRVLVELVSPCAQVLAHAQQAPVAWGQEPFHHFVEFGLGGPEPVPAGVLEAVGLEAVEPEAEARLEAPFEAGATIDVSSISGIVPGVSLPVRPEHVFEQGAPIYLSTAGPVAGTLADMRVFSEDGWVAGDRLCFHTSFGSRFDPVLPVCLPADEARLRNPSVEVHDFGPMTVRPGTLRVTGALAEPVVARALRRHRHDLRRCLGEAIGRGHWPTEGHELELAIDVSGKGRIDRVRLLSPKLESLSDCAVAAAERWVMPAPDDRKPAEVVLSVKLVRR